MSENSFNITTNIIDNTDYFILNSDSDFIVIIFGD
jgi:hypothetical protein